MAVVAGGIAYTLSCRKHAGRTPLVTVLVSHIAVANYHEFRETAPHPLSACRQELKADRFTITPLVLHRHLRTLAASLQGTENIESRVCCRQTAQKQGNSIARQRLAHHSTHIDKYTGMCYLVNTTRAHARAAIAQQEPTKIFTRHAPYYAVGHEMWKPASHQHHQRHVFEAYNEAYNPAKSAFPPDL